MWTYSTISLVVMLGVLGAGGLGFAAGWLVRRALFEERDAAAGAEELVSQPARRGARTEIPAAARRSGS